jgi:hypothetical protein
VFGLDLTRASTRALKRARGLRAVVTVRHLVQRRYVVDADGKKQKVPSRHFSRQCSSLFNRTPKNERQIILIGIVCSRWTPATYSKVKIIDRCINRLQYTCYQEVIFERSTVTRPVNGPLKGIQTYPTNNDYNLALYTTTAITLYDRCLYDLRNEGLVK